MNSPLVFSIYDIRGRLVASGKPPYSDLYEGYFSKEDYDTFYGKLFSMRDAVRKGESPLNPLSWITMITLMLILGSALFLPVFVYAYFFPEYTLMKFLGPSIACLVLGPMVLLLCRRCANRRVDAFNADLNRLCDEFQQAHPSLKIISNLMVVTHYSMYNQIDTYGATINLASSRSVSKVLFKKTVSAAPYAEKSRDTNIIRILPS